MPANQYSLASLVLLGVSASLFHQGGWPQSPPLPPPLPPCATPQPVLQPAGEVQQHHLTANSPLPPPHVGLAANATGGNATCYDYGRITPAEQLTSSSFCQVMLGEAGAITGDTAPGAAFVPPPLLRDGVTLIVPTYKGYVTLSATMQTWNSSGLLHHPQLTDAVVHINACSCENKQRTLALFGYHAPHLRTRVLCSENNVLHPRVMLLLVLEVRTKLFLYTENDRPTLTRTAEMPAAYRARVATVLNLAFQTAANPATPYVHIHRMGLSQADEEAYVAWKRQGVREMAASSSSGGSGGVAPAGSGGVAKLEAAIVWGKSPGVTVPASHMAALPVELTRPHQQPNDITGCWTYCVDIAQAWNESDAYEHRLNVLSQCQHLLDRSPPDQAPADRGERCKWFACKEFQQWANGPRSSPGGATDDSWRNLMCSRPWMRDLQTPGWWSARYSVHQEAPFLSCMRSNHFVNAPAVTNRNWYITKVVPLMCGSDTLQKKSGLKFNKWKKRFKHYGKRMELFLMGKLAGNTVCYTDGITEHIETEEYDLDRVAKDPDM